MATLMDTESSQENHQRFVRRVVESQVVWGLANADGFATCPSNEKEKEKAQDVLMFWSDRGYASRVRQRAFPDYEPKEISLFDFLYRWLPGMANDHVRAGTNWTGDLIGMEIDPQSLREELTARMPAELLSAYKKRLEDEVKKQG